MSRRVEARDVVSSAGWIVRACGGGLDRPDIAVNLGITIMGGRIANREDMATLMRRVDVDAVTGCWLWRGTVVGGGHGQIEAAGRVWLAHIFSWALHHRPDFDEAALVAPDRLVLQRCDNPGCVNPDHLYLGARVDPSRGRRAARPGRGIRQLTDDQVREIRGGGLNDATYARRFGVSTPTVRDIRSGKTKILVPDYVDSAQSYAPR